MNRLLLTLVIILTFSFKNLYCQIDTINQYYFNNLRTVLSKDPNVKKIKFIQKKISNNQGLLQTMFVKYRNDKDNRYWHVGKQFIINTSNSTLGFVRNADIRNGNIIDTAFSYSPDGTIAAMQIYTTKFDSVIPMKTGFNFMSSVFGKYYENVPNTYKEITYSCDKDTIIEGIYKFSRHDKGIVTVEGFFPDGDVIYYNRRKEIIKRIHYKNGIIEVDEQKTDTTKNTYEVKNESLKKESKVFKIDNATFRQLSEDSVCCDDTVIVINDISYPKDFKLPDMSDAYYATYCVKKSNAGFRLEFGYSQCFNNKSVADWIGHNPGVNMGLVMIINNLNIGFRFKPTTISPKSELTFDNKVLSKNADLDPYKYDYYVGYEFKLNDKYSFEPSFGYENCTFKVINEEKLNETYSFNQANGFIIGLTINKNIPIVPYKNFVLYSRISYSTLDFSKVHRDLGKGYFELSLGISFKGYFTTKTYQKIKNYKG